LFLTCSGSCQPIPKDDVSVVEFDAKARGSQAKALPIANKMDKPWYLRPILTGVHWKCADQVRNQISDTDHNTDNITDIDLGGSHKGQGFAECEQDRQAVVPPPHHHGRPLEVRRPGAGAKEIREWY
jgi:hypothetical protein